MTDITGTFIPVPLIEILLGLVWFVASWVMERLAEVGPAVVGENRTVTVTDWPGAKLNAPPPLTTEKGGKRDPTFPVNTPVELASFMIVIVWLANCPTSIFPKLRPAGAIDMLMTGGAVVIAKARDAYWRPGGGVLSVWHPHK